MHRTNDIAKWCLFGIFGVTILGVLLHNAYVWTRSFSLLAPIAPVNESVWEHLKMSFWAVVLFSCIEYPFAGKMAHNYFPAKATGVTVLILCIVLVFYSYTAFTGRSILWIDISSFVLGVALCQWVTCRLFRVDPLARPYQLGSLLYLLAVAALFAAFTYFPPEMAVFRDHSTEAAGVHN